MCECDKSGVSRFEFHKWLATLSLLLMCAWLSRAARPNPPGAIYPQWLTDAMGTAALLSMLVFHAVMSYRLRPRRGP
jgi:hypothetical protein